MDFMEPSVANSGEDGVIIADQDQFCCPRQHEYEHISLSMMGKVNMQGVCTVHVLSNRLLHLIQCVDKEHGGNLQQKNITHKLFQPFSG
jgi:hypothetical protein